MAKKEELLHDPEVAALAELQGIDPAELLETGGGPKDPPADPPPGDPPAPTPPPTDPPAPPADPPKPNDPPAPEPQTAFLKEIFGDRFQTVEDAKNANISGSLDEIETLRQEKTDLESKLAARPKTDFANDEVAIFNEFVRETGNRDYAVFNRIHNADLANMDSMDALTTQYILEHPELAGKEPQVRKYFEKKYNVDPDQVDEEDLAVNKIGMEADGATAKRSLQELKDKLKVPETTYETPKPKELSPEEKSKLQDGWSGIGQGIGSQLAKLKVPIKNGKEPLLDYEISESEQKEIREFVTQYAVENQMELNEDNVRTVSAMVYNTLMVNKIPDIVHSVFEKARTMTEEQVHALYENPSPAKNTDTPPVPPTPPMTDEEKMQDEIFNAEMDAYNE